MSIPQRGFTLIELLVVIAIMGVLASIVISFLNTANNKAEDSAVKDGMSRLRTAAEDEYIDNGSYLFACATHFSDASPESDKILHEVFKHARGGGYCQWGPTFYYVHLFLKGGGLFCVDSRGVASTTTTFPVIGQTHC